MRELGRQPACSLRIEASLLHSRLSIRGVRPVTRFASTLRCASPRPAVDAARCAAIGRDVCVVDKAEERFANTAMSRREAHGRATDLHVPASRVREPASTVQAAAEQRAAHRPRAFRGSTPRRSARATTMRAQGAGRRAGAEEERLAERSREYNSGAPERRGEERNAAKYQERIARLRQDVSCTESNVEALCAEIGAA